MVFKISISLPKKLAKFCGNKNSTT